MATIDRWLKSHKKPIVVQLLPFILISIFLFSTDICSAADYWPGEQWRTATPESQGMSSEILADMMDVLWRDNIEMDSILIIRNGYVVLDTYHFPRGSDSKHNIFSCTKSISSTLIGITIDEAYIKNVDQSLLGFFPEKAPKNPDALKEQITLKDVLEMATGLECRDSYLYRWEGLNEMRWSEDWVQYMLDLPMMEPPGTRFEYCNGASFLLTAIIEKTTGKTASEFAKEHLFNPMGIKDVYWPANIHGQTIGWGRIHMRPRDMARFGYLFLRNGTWNNRQIVSAKWVAEATRKQIPATILPGYGYQWWVMGPGNYAAVGYRGQRIYVLKDKQLVVVFTGRLKDGHARTPEGILRGYILPAVQSDGPLSENGNAFNRLESLDRFWRTADYEERDKRRKTLAPKRKSPQMTPYVNKAPGFRAEYDAELVVPAQNLDAPFVFSRSGIRGLPAFMVTVDHIPQGLPLKDSEKYVIQYMKGMERLSNVHLNNKEMIHLADNTQANYFEIGANIQNAKIITVGVIAYKNKKLIGVYAVSLLDTPMEYLKGMVRSLCFDTKKP